MSPLHWSYLMLAFWFSWLVFTVFMFFWAKTSSYLHSRFFFFFFYYGGLELSSSQPKSLMFYSNLALFKIHL